MKQPEALRLADELVVPIYGFPDPTQLEAKAAAELRRLHEVNQKLAESCAELLGALEKSLKLLEEYEVKIDGEWGTGASLQRLDAEGRLPIEILEARAAIAKAKEQK